MFRVFGPPGTGKTTTLLNMVDNALEKGVPPERIAFLAFTRKAAYEARDRAAARFNLDPQKELPYFRTIHSLALRVLGLRTEQILKSSDLKEFANRVGIDVTGTAEEGEEAYKPDHPVLQLLALATTKKVPLREEYNRNHTLSHSWEEVDYITRAYNEYKKVNGLYDFTDMLVSFLDYAPTACPEFELCFLDEAQDLTPLQWDIAHLLDSKSQRMYCAGDDDQAIYKWAGADVDSFIGLPGGSETLEQSYRIPASVHEVAMNIATRIHKRYPKVYRPRKEAGLVRRIRDVNDVDMSEGSWLILAQARYMLYPSHYELKSGGFLFDKQGRSSINPKLSTAVNAWEQLRKGKSIALDAAKTMYGLMSSGSRVERGFKKIQADEEALFTLPSLQKDHGLLAGEEMVWHEALDKIPDAERAYIVALLRRGEKFNAPPRITVSTIHGAKGGEADNVVLMTDLTAAADSERQIEPDNLNRVFYVGVTRTRQKLYLVEPENTYRSFEI
ncbi:MAG: hypothetical protein CL902_13895 [Dehalococcoidia bacterium]|jgi:superfamily I DNA/RNA helicase|nr:hypothetical protein [Dehalococcoidia bacterium]